MCDYVLNSLSERRNPVSHSSGCFYRSYFIFLFKAPVEVLDYYITDGGTEFHKQFVASIHRKKKKTKLYSTHSTDWIIVPRSSKGLPSRESKGGAAAV